MDLINSKKLKFGGLVGGILASSLAVSQDNLNSLQINHLNVDKTDYVGESYGLEGTAFLPFAKVFGVIENECGETRVDPFKNIFSFSNKSEQEWVDYCGEKKGVKIGSKVDIFDGELKFGVGYGTQTFVSEVDLVPGEKFKDIKYTQKGALVEFESEDLRVGLDYNELIEDYSLGLSSNLGPFFNYTDKKIETFDFDLENSILNLNFVRIQGSRSDSYSSSLLVPVSHDYSNNKVYVGAKFNGFEVGPVFRSGSVEGSLTEIELDSGVSGVFGKYNFSDDSSVFVGLESYSGNGKRGLFPMANEISEGVDVDSFSVGYESSDFNVSFSRNEEFNTGDLVVNAPYSMILRGSEFSNSRNVREDVLSVSKDFGNLELKFDGVNRDISDSQFGRKESVSEKELRFGLNFKF